MHNYSSIIALIVGIVLFSLLAASSASFDPEIDGFGNNWQAFHATNKPIYLLSILIASFVIVFSCTELYFSLYTFR